MVEGIGFGVALAAAGLAIWWALPARTECWRTLPRERVAGILLGIVCLAWTVTLVAPLLEGSLARFRPLLWPLMAALAVGCYFHLDYLLTRALGGFLVLMTTHLMHQAFILHAPGRPALSVVCYGLGILGIFMISSPYHFRDVLERATRSRGWRGGVGGGLMAAGLVNLIVFMAAWR